MQSSFARPWKLEQTTSGQGFETGLSLKIVEIGVKQYDKEGAFFWSSKRKKKLSRKRWLSSNGGDVIRIDPMMKFNLQLPRG